MAYHEVAVFHPQRTVTFIAEPYRASNKPKQRVNADDMDDGIPKVPFTLFGFAYWGASADLRFNNIYGRLNCLNKGSLKPLL